MASDINATIDASDVNATINVSDVSANLGLPKEKVVKDYEVLQNKPSINDVILRGNKTFEDLGDHILTNTEILNLYKKVKGL